MLVGKCIKRHFNRNKLIFFVFIACQICSVLAFCFVFLYVNSVQKYNEGDIVISVHVSESVDSNAWIGQAEHLYNNYEDVIHQAYSLIDHNEQLYKANYVYNGDYDRYLRAGSYFDADNHSPSYLCIAGADTALKVGDSIDLFGVEHTVIGISNRDEWEISKSTLSQIPGLNNMFISLFPDTPKSVQNQVVNEIKETFPNCEMILSQDKLTFWECMSGMELILFTLILIVININFSGLFIYLMKEDRSMIQTFRILGCTMPNAIWLSLQEILLLTTGSFAVGMLLFQTVIGRLISFLNSNFVPLLPWSSVGYIFILYILSIIVIFIPLTWHQYKKHVFLSGGVGS